MNTQNNVPVGTNANPQYPPSNLKQPQNSLPSNKRGAISTTTPDIDQTIQALAPVPIHPHSSAPFRLVSTDDSLRQRRIVSHTQTQSHNNNNNGIDLSSLSPNAPREVQATIRNYLQEIGFNSLPEVHSPSTRQNITPSSIAVVPRSLSAPILPSSNSLESIQNYKNAFIKCLRSAIQDSSIQPSSSFIANSLNQLDFLIQQTPNDPELYLIRSQIKSKIGNFSDAIDELVTYIHQYYSAPDCFPPPNYWTQVIRILENWIIHLEIQKTSDMNLLRCLQHLILKAHMPATQARLLEIQARNSMLLGNYQLAEIIYKKAFEKVPEQITLGIGLANCYHLQGKDEDALSVLEHILSEHEFYQTALELKSQICLKAKQFAGAYQAMQKLSNTYKDNFNYTLEALSIRLQASLKSPISDLIDRIVQFKNLDAMKQLIQLLMQYGQFEEASAVLERAFALNQSTDNNLQSLQAVILYWEKQYDKALDALKCIVPINKQDQIQVFVKEARIYLDQDNTVEAMRSLKPCLNQPFFQPIICTIYAEALLKQQDYTLALESIKKAEELTENQNCSFMGYIHLVHGEIEVAKKNYEAAKEIVNKIVFMGPNDYKIGGCYSPNTMSRYSKIKEEIAENETVASLTNLNLDNQKQTSS